MVVEVRRRPNEGAESLFRRFSRKVQQSGVLLQARKVRFYSRKKSRARRREDAKRRVELQKERERLVKLGEIDEFSEVTSRRRR
jgi:ribosomal protein S21